MTCRISARNGCPFGMEFKSRIKELKITLFRWWRELFNTVVTQDQERAMVSSNQCQIGALLAWVKFHFYEAWRKWHLIQGYLNPYAILFYSYGMLAKNIRIEKKGKTMSTKWFSLEILVGTFNGITFQTPEFAHPSKALKITRGKVVTHWEPTTGRAI